MRVLYALCFILLMTSCKRSVNTSSEESVEVDNIIDLTAGFNNIQVIRLSEIADSVSFIPFETTQESLQGVGQNMLTSFSPRFIIYHDKIYDWNGKFGGSIIKRGQGPLEEPQGGSLMYNNHHLYSKATKLIEYDLTGKPTGKVKQLLGQKDDWGQNYLNRSTSFSPAGENFIFYDSPSTIYFIDSNFETISSYTVFQTDSSTSKFSFFSPAGKFITYYQDIVLFYNFVNDTVFQVTDSILEPRWIVSFEHPLRLPIETMFDNGNMRKEFQNAIASGHSIENTLFVQRLDHRLKVLAAYETELNVFLLMTELMAFAPERGFPFPDPYIILFNKTNGQTTRVKEKGFVDDLLDMDFFYPQLGVFDEKMITYIWPYELFDFIEDRAKKGREVNPQVLALSKKIDTEDNPILIVAHLKKQ